MGLSVDVRDLFLHWQRIIPALMGVTTWNLINGVVILSDGARTDVYLQDQ